MYPEPLQRLIDQFSRFPTIGPRTAARLAFYLLKRPKEELEDLARTISLVQDSIRVCAFCFNMFAPERDGQDRCPVCLSPSRDASLLCVVEKESDLEAIERAHVYRGLYFILGGSGGMLRKEDIERLRIPALRERIERPTSFGLPGPVREVILAVNPTAEGEAVTLLLERTIQELGIKTSRLARGIPMGGEIEYADDETLRNALEGRR